MEIIFKDSICVLADETATLCLKLLYGEVWGEFDTKRPLDRNLIRHWTKELETIKSTLKSQGLDSITVGCSTMKRVKYLEHLFNFKKTKEAAVNGQIWHVLQLCF